MSKLLVGIITRRKQQVFVSTDESRPPRLPHSGEVDEEQTLALNAAVENLVRLGERGGVSPKQIAALLDSGMGLDELVRHLVAKVSRVG